LLITFTGDLRASILARMAQLHGTEAILVVNADLGFVIWAGEALSKAGYTPWPAKTVADAQKWIEEPAFGFRLLLIDLALSGAADLIQTVRERYPGLKIVAVGTDSKNAIADAVISKPTNFDDPKTVQEWAGAVAQLLSEHPTR
jgi:DNA-binding NtrC family response regulator